MKATHVILYFLMLTAVLGCQKARFSSIKPAVKTIEVVRECEDKPPLLIVPQNCRVIEKNAQNLSVLCDDGILIPVTQPHNSNHDDDKDHDNNEQEHKEDCDHE